MRSFSSSKRRATWCRYSGTFTTEKQSESGRAVSPHPTTHLTPDSEQNTQKYSTDCYLVLLSIFSTCRRPRITLRSVKVTGVIICGLHHIDTVSFRYYKSLILFLKYTQLLKTTTPPHTVALRPAGCLLAIFPTLTSLSCISRCPSAAYSRLVSARNLSSKDSL